MRQHLLQIYRDLADGRLSRPAALAKIEALSRHDVEALNRHDVEPENQTLLAAPVWEVSADAIAITERDFSERHIVLCGFSPEEVSALRKQLPHSHCVAPPSSPSKNVAERYSDYALACFEKLKAILQSRHEGQVLIQVVIRFDEEGGVFAGLAGLLKTAMLEYPQLTGQLILAAPSSISGWVRILERERANAQDTLVHYGDQQRRVRRWELLPGRVNVDRAATRIAFKDQGVYLITGGLGGVGLLVAKEILQQASRARIILTGRSALNAQRQARLDALAPQPGQRVEYRTLDLVDPDRTRDVIAEVSAECPLDGILHCAGMGSDNFIVKKSAAEFSQVLAPKVIGTFNLDQATREVELDFLVLFSSVASVTGNVGQADYAAANGFMDAFAAYRNQLARAGLRRGVTLSINWSLWRDGGMRLDESRQELLRQTAGIEPLQTSTALQALHESLQSSSDQVLVLHGERARLRRVLAEQTMQLVPERPELPERRGAPERLAAPEQSGVLERLAAPEQSRAPERLAVRERSGVLERSSIQGMPAPTASLLTRTEELLCRELSALLKVPAHRIDAQAALEKYGIDSIMAVNLITQLEKTFGPLSKTLMFEYQTLRALAEYLCGSRAERLAQLFAQMDGNAAVLAVPSQQPRPASQPTSQPTGQATSQAASRRIRRGRLPPRAAPEADPIAIIGISGRYPEAPDIDAYWRNLRDAKDCITEVPLDRWDWRKYFSRDRTRNGYHYSKWGGFIAGVDEFDPLFFNISPKEAKSMDPQERLFLQHAWMAIEDAGLTRAGLQGPAGQGLPGQVGVYVGAMYSEYQLFGAEASLRGRRMGVAGSFSSIANRVSYTLNLHGPSMALDTMCSSSLTAIHLACQDLHQGRTRLAVAGGVNVSIHPNKYLVLSAGQFISSDGHCQSFGEGGDGYIPGEGVGVVILARLSEAQRDGLPVYGLIRGTALNHGGKTNGYTVPNPQAQTDVIRHALAEAQVSARQISYLEAHGTGTKLGDPIEIAALTNAFYGNTSTADREVGFCSIGSAKSNIGHCESAAGIAGLTKVLLQMKHGLIVPSLHSTKLNPHIDFSNTPFVVNQTLKGWEQPQVHGRRVPRIAGISSFGAGGSNAHVIVEEYQPPPQAARSTGLAGKPVIVPLSARNDEQLRQKARDLLSFIDSHASAVDFESMAYTLQVGREPMNARVGFITDTAEQLAQKLERFLAGERIPDEVADPKLSKWRDGWAEGSPTDWEGLWEGRARPPLMSLPAYPFAKERYWIDTAAPATGETTVPTAETTVPTDVELTQGETASPSTVVATGRWSTRGLRNSGNVIPKKLQVALAPVDDLELSPQTSRARVTLRDVASQSSLPQEKVRLVDCGDGVFSIEPPPEWDNLLQSTRLIESLYEALSRASEEPSLKVLLLQGTQSAFWSGDRRACNEAIERRLLSMIATFPYPVIAVMSADACGLGFLLGAVCDLMVCSEEGRYACTDAQHGIFASSTEERFLRKRLGEVAADDFLYSPAPLRGRQLQQKGWGCWIVPGAEVAAKARELAATLVEKPQTALRLLKAHLARDLVPLVDAITIGHEVSARSADSVAANAIRSPSEHIELQVEEATLLVKLTAHQPYGLTDCIADLKIVFDQIQQSSSFTAVVLASEQAGFLPPSETGGLAVAEDLKFLVQGCKIPVITALAGDPSDMAWWLGLWSDGCVYDAQGHYRVASDGALPPEVAALLTRQLGSALGQEVCLTAQSYSGLDLQLRSGALCVVESSEVVREALRRAGFWRSWALETVTEWKRARIGAVNELIAAQTSDAAPTSDAAQISDATQTGDVAQTSDVDVPEENVADPPDATTTPTATPITLSSESVSVTAYSDGVVTISLHDRQTKNLFSAALIDGLKEAFAHIAQTPAYKVVVLNGYDTYFASGGTHETLLAIQEGRAKFTDERSFHLPMDCPLPVIAAMQGHGIGGGWSFGMFADVILFSEESRYVSPYMGYGFTPGAGSTLVFPEKIGYDLARETLLTANEMSGHDLRLRGLPFAVLARREVIPAAMELARNIARQPRKRLQRLKHQWTQALRQSREDVYAREVQMHDQTFIGQAGTLERIEAKFRNADDPASDPASRASPQAVPASMALPAVVEKLRTLLAQELHLKPTQIDENVQFIDLGLDSVTGVTWMRKINEHYGTSIEATKAYSHPTLSALARLVQENALKAAPPARPPELPSTLRAAPTPPTPIARGAGAPRLPKESSLPAVATRLVQGTPEKRSGRSYAPASERIAVIGMAGQFPQAGDLEQFWKNIALGRDCITEVPGTRWAVDAYYQPGETVPGKTNCRWVGALEHYDRFDPLFFNISPTEARSMDPQQRVFLQTCWHAIEDAGYSPKAFSGSRCGVFAGCAQSDYHQLSEEERLSAQGFTGAASSILAARISYFLNLQGPCLSIDTACSSSLVAIANACDGLNSGNFDIALAGGVYVMAGPDMHIKAAQAGMLSSDGRCFVFDQRANGFVPGEAVGVVVLKRLEDAERDRDLIYGVIEGWGVNQDGKTNGITAPNPQSQTRLQQEVYDRYGIDPASIQLVEAHGTGTKLGDPIEVEGLKSAFDKYTGRRQYCALGSVKSNIGHCLTAAGIASLIKVLLSIKHQQLPPSIHFESLNEHIVLEDSPFYVNRHLQPWETERNAPRRGAVSSFGFSGTNAHLVIGEYRAPTGANDVATATAPRVIVPLSARAPEQLLQRARDLLGWIERSPGIDLQSMAYTLQCGREAMEERLGFVVSSTEELTRKLAAWIAGEREIAECYTGQVKRNREAVSLIGEDPDLMATILERWIAQQKLSQLLDLWVKGLPLDWHALYGQNVPRRMRLPLYPFAKERFWIEPPARASGAASGESLHEERSEPGVIRAVPVWQVKAAEREGRVAFTDRHVLVCGLEARVAGCGILNAPAAGSLADRYIAYAAGCFEHIREILRSKVSGRVLLQVVVNGTQGLGGLSGLLKTASLENPQLVSQLIEMHDVVTNDELARCLDECDTHERVIRYQGGERQVQRWHVSRAGTNDRTPCWKEDGVYLITGGLGGLGQLFARDILAQTQRARVILTGRSAPGRDQGGAVRTISADGSRLEYRVADVTNRQQVQELIGAIRTDYGKLNGILHGAGVIADNFILKKETAEFVDILGAKVQGAVHLDEASREVPLDFLVLFSSVAAVLGNVGQADYAAANGFMDAFAHYRNDLVARGERFGQTIAINWPLWAAGGMRMDEASLRQLEELTGVRAMSTRTGIDAFHESLQSGEGQWLVMEGEVERLESILHTGRPVQYSSQIPLQGETDRPAFNADSDWLQDRVLERLKGLVGEVLRLSPMKIDVHEELASYGLDSIIITKLNRTLAQVFGDIPKTLFFEYKTLSSFAPYLIREYPQQCLSWAGAGQQQIASLAPVATQAPLNQSQRPSASPSSGRRTRQRQIADTVHTDRRAQPIAIIGLSGLYPQAATLSEYWANLVAGRHCVGEIPAKRWPLAGFYHPNDAEAVRQGKSYSKWGGFLEQFDQFDPLFFGIAPRDATSIDPQERLFLQAAWHALEDSGYTRADLRHRFGRRVGVFAGITKAGFNLHGGRTWRPDEPFHPYTSFSSVANRLSYFLDITGPSMPIDTMCSSSLTAIHEACEHIHRGECDLAFAGGVNLYLHPTTYVDMSTQYALSRDGICRSFGAGANGFVPGEGVGVVLLKPLAAAVDDGDVIHGLILATHVNHGGKTNGYTVPSPRAQAELVRRAIEKAGINARDISYVEAHGTGTELGDPIEIEGLHAAFAPDTRETGYCRIGSAKSNIGHLEAAAGMAGVTKVLLQMKHGFIAPSLHAEQVNPNIAFARTPFVLNRELMPWESKGADGSPTPRIAGISSFGAGGANAHVILKEYRRPIESTVADTSAVKVAIPLSARTPEQLRRKARDLLDWLRAEPGAGLVEIAYTLQVGREAMEARVGFVASSVQELEERLQAYVIGQNDSDGRYQGHVQGINGDLALISQDEDMQATIDKWIAGRKVVRLLEWWVRGLKLDWNKLYVEARPRRVSLPVYPFAADRYWLPAPAAAREVEVTVDVTAHLTSIEELIDQVDADSIDASRAARMLSALVT